MKVQWGGGILESKRKNPKDLQRFTKNKKLKTIIIGSIIGIIIIIGGINLYRTFALYKEEQSFNVLNGVVPNFSGDIKLAIVVDGKEAEEIPIKENNKNYEVKVECDKEAKGSWDYYNWRVNVENFKKNTKCNVTFTTTEEEMPSSINIYFTTDGDFSKIIESLGKQSSDFTEKNFRAVISSYNTGATLNTGGDNWTVDTSINYSSQNGIVSLNNAASAGRLNKCIGVTTLKISGYVFDPSKTPFGISQ